MSDISNEILLGILILLIFLSGFFSSSETGLMAINRVRLQHLAEEGSKGASRILTLLERPDRLIGLILMAITSSTFGISYRDGTCCADFCDPGVDRNRYINARHFYLPKSHRRHSQRFIPSVSLTSKLFCFRYYELPIRLSG